MVKTGAGYWLGSKGVYLGLKICASIGLDDLYCMCGGELDMELDEVSILGPVLLTGQEMYLLMEVCQPSGRTYSVNPPASSTKYQLGEMRDRDTVCGIKGD